MIDMSARKDFQDASVYEGKDFSSLLEYMLPKFYMKTQYCISCAIHSKTVRVRSVDRRKKRKEHMERFSGREKQFKDRRRNVEKKKEAVRVAPREEPKPEPAPAAEAVPSV
eukprot:TRINITY_DN10112_c0_g1_i2.p1 TRINITY_DN10112_c0_g1~~TRINITY_DN10112_c0_g1_i2.p1  ORF type:complete len:111 (+),score=37.00 TRINITY_DN10112_c0_g1_i2:301-633(+)